MARLISSWRASGTGGTITGGRRIIKSAKPSFKAIAVEPAKSPVLAGGSLVPQAAGIGRFIPDN